jgi:RNA polymerase sigma factor (TIGR02999 family)
MLDLMSDVTRILTAIDQGDAHAAAQLLPLVYDELRKLAAQRLAREAPGQTLQPTALVHEAYLRLVEVEKAQLWNSRGHFFAAAAEAMRRILVERARQRHSSKRGGLFARHDLDAIDLADDEPPEVLLALDGALPSWPRPTPWRPTWSNCGTSPDYRCRRRPTYSASPRERRGVCGPSPGPGFAARSKATRNRTKIAEKRGQVPRRFSH